MHVFLDMDGVIVDWTKAAMEFHGLNYPQYPCPGRWDWVGHLGLSPKVFWKPLSREFYANLPWTEDGPEILKIIVDTVGWDNITILTSPILQGGCAAGKIDWLQREIPELDRQFLIGPQKHLLASPNNVLIDDAQHNIAKWNGPRILVPRIWNYNMNLNPLTYIKERMVYYETIIGCGNHAGFGCGW